MNNYLVPNGSVLELPAEPEWSRTISMTAEQFETVIEHRTSYRDFEPTPIPPNTISTAVLDHLAEVQRTIDGIRFVCAVNNGAHDRRIWTLDDDGSLVDPYEPPHWVELFLQEEFATSPFVAVAVINTDCAWREFEHQMVSSTAALGRVWLTARVEAPGTEGSIFAGVLAGWLRSTGRISRNESTGVALALGYPITKVDAVPPAAANHNPQPTGEKP